MIFSIHIEIEAPQNGNRACSSQTGVVRTPSDSALNQTMPVISMPADGMSGGIACPTTNLNIGMDYWGATSAAPIPPIRAKAPAAAVVGAMVPGGPSELWMQVFSKYLFQLIIQRMS